jgi:uncharacterized protein
LHHDSLVTRDEYIERIARGGFPDAIWRTPTRRTSYLRSYVDDLINRDVTQLSEIERGHEMQRLVKMLAARSGQLLTPSALGNDLGISALTVNKYITLLEEVFLVKRIRPWSRKIGGGRETSQQKLAFVDSGIASALLGMTPQRLRKPGAPLGGLVESFVAMEISKQFTWSENYVDLSHYRTRDGNEVDIILENDIGEIIGIEVKASTTPRADDFTGLKYLEKRVGKYFIAGYLLHMGKNTTWWPKNESPTHKHPLANLAKSIKHGILANALARFPSPAL